jgi:hypothetical protein
VPRAGELIEAIKPEADDPDHAVHFFRVVAVSQSDAPAITSVYVVSERPADAIKIDGHHRINVDFRAKKAEWQWQDVFDIFWLDFTPTWFEWVQWLLVLGALGYVAHLTHSRLIGILNGMSYWFLWFYFQSYFFRIEFIGIPFLSKREGLRRTVSLCISGALALGAWLLVYKVVPELAKTSP